MKIAFVFTGTWVTFFAAKIWSWSSAVDCQYPAGCSGCLHLLVDIYVLGSDHKDSSYQTQPGETLPVPPLHKHSYLCSFGWAHFFSFCGRILDDILLVPVLLYFVFCSSYSSICGLHDLVHQDSQIFQGWLYHGKDLKSWCHNTDLLLSSCRANEGPTLSQHWPSAKFL